MICLPGGPGNWWLALSGTWSHHSSANWKVEKEYFALPSDSQYSWSEKILWDFLLSSSPPPGGVILNPLTGLCLAVASDVSTLDLLIFEFRSEALHLIRQWCRPTIQMYKLTLVIQAELRDGRYVIISIFMLLDLGAIAVIQLCPFSPLWHL